MHNLRQLRLYKDISDRDMSGNHTTEALHDVEFRARSLFQVI